MVRLQVKYCYNEYDLNEFLKTLCVNDSTKYPKLHLIQYLPKVEGEGHDYYDEELNEMRSKAVAGCSIVAMVQYFDEIAE